MSSISTINTVTKKYFLPIEIENIIYTYLTIDDYDKPRSIFNLNFLNRMSPRYPSYTMFNGILGNEKNKYIIDPIMRYIYFKTKNLLKDTDFYNIYEYDEDLMYIEEASGYAPNWTNLEFINEDVVGDWANIRHPKGFDNIRILAESLRQFRLDY
jgi:hypothetical protein